MKVRILIYQIVVVLCNIDSYYIVGNSLNEFHTVLSLFMDSILVYSFYYTYVWLYIYNVSYLELLLYTLRNCVNYYIFYFNIMIT